VRVVIGLLGAVLITIGLVGIVLPILPGWVLIIGGLLLLSREFDWADRTVTRLKDLVERRRPGRHTRDIA